MFCDARQRVCFFECHFLVLCVSVCQVRQHKEAVLPQDPEKYGLVNRSFNLVVQLGELLCWGNWMAYSLVITYIAISYMGVSKNRGTPKSSILIGFSIINHPFWGTPIFGNTYMYLEYTHPLTV